MVKTKALFKEASSICYNISINIHISNTLVPFMLSTVMFEHLLNDPETLQIPELF